MERTRIVDDQRRATSTAAAMRRRDRRDRDERVHRRRGRARRPRRRPRPPSDPAAVGAAGVEVAPLSERVDLTMPTFSHPTDITNPLFPVSDQASVLMLGHVEGKPFRTEVTLLPETRIVRWEGQEVETAVSQYVAFLGGRIEEVAYDLYAQADDGSVWYFGEDVFDFRDGAIVVTEGTWLAGRDGPAAMIMPADPQVGDVYRTENAPGFVFEEVTVGSVSRDPRRATGPDPGRDARGGAPHGRRHRGQDLRARLRRVLYLGRRRRGGARARRADGRERPAGPGGAHDDLGRSLGGLRRGEQWEPARRERCPRPDPNGVGRVPGWRRRPAADRTVDGSRGRATDQGDRGTRTLDGCSTRRSRSPDPRSISSFGSALVPEIDLARMDLWAAQLLVDEAAGDDAGVAADAFALDYVRDRIRPSSTRPPWPRSTPSSARSRSPWSTRSPPWRRNRPEALRRTLRDAGLVA